MLHNSHLYFYWNFNPLLVVVDFYLFWETLQNSELIISHQHSYYLSEDYGKFWISHNVHCYVKATPLNESVGAGTSFFRKSTSCISLKIRVENLCISSNRSILLTKWIEVLDVTSLEQRNLAQNGIKFRLERFKSNFMNNFTFTPDVSDAPKRDNIHNCSSDPWLYISLHLWLCKTHRHVDVLPQLCTGQLVQFICDNLMDSGFVSIVQARHLHNGNVAVSSGLYWHVL